MLTAINQFHLGIIGLILFIFLGCGIEELSLLHDEAKEADVPFRDFLKDIWFKK